MIMDLTCDPNSLPSNREPDNDLAQTQPDNSSRSSRTVLRFLWFAALAYATASTFGDMFYGEKSFIIATGLVLITFVYMQIRGIISVKIPFHLKISLFIFFHLAIINIFVSTDSISSGIRWTIWFTLVFCYVKLARTSDETLRERLYSSIPLMMSVFYVLLWLKATFFADSASRGEVWHLSGVYANLTLATGIFAPSTRFKVLWVGLGLVGVFLSGAAGAALSVPLSLIPYTIYKLRANAVRTIVASILVIVVGAFLLHTTDLVAGFLERKVAVHRFKREAGLERAERSGDQRLELAKIGLELSMQHPWGTGLGRTYTVQASRNNKLGHVHNGFIGMLVEIGWLAFVLMMAWIIISFRRILRSKNIPANFKAFYFSFVATVFSRSLSEGYGLLNLASISNQLLLFLTFYLLYCCEQTPAKPLPEKPEPQLLDSSRHYRLSACLNSTDS